MQSAPHFNPYAPPKADVDPGLQALPDDVMLADRGTRLAAVVLDWLLYIAALVPSFMLVAAAYRSDDLLEDLFRVLLAMLVALTFEIYQWYLLTTTGQSLGKRWLGIQVVRTDGTPAGFVHGVVLRHWILTAASVFIPYLGALVRCVVSPLMIFGEERRCLHDHFAGTRVIVALKS